MDLADDRTLADDKRFSKVAFSSGSTIMLASTAVFKVLPVAVCSTLDMEKNQTHEGFQLSLRRVEVILVEVILQAWQAGDHTSGQS